MVKKLQASVLPATVVDAIQQRELQAHLNLQEQIKLLLGDLKIGDALAMAGWKSDVELMRDALRRFEYATDLRLYARWVESDDEQDAASEIIGILQDEVTDPDRAEAWIESHRDELTPALLAAIVRTAMKLQLRKSVEPMLAGKKLQRERWAEMLDWWEEMERRGVIGKKREDEFCEKFPIGRQSIHSTLTKARKARSQAQQVS
jgi:hypothetical protein